MSPFEFFFTTEEMYPYLDDAKRDGLLSLLPLSRAARIRSPRKVEDRARRLAAEVALRRVLREAGESYAHLEIAYTPTGKPYFRARPDLSFSLSHSSGMACVALVRAAEVAPRVGTDIEEIVSGDAFARRCRAADRFFSPSFMEELARTAESEKPRVFTRLWCLTEAAGKATGEGSSDFREADRLIALGESREVSYPLDSHGIRYASATVLLPPSEDSPV